MSRVGQKHGSIGTKHKVLPEGVHQHDNHPFEQGLGGARRVRGASCKYMGQREHRRVKGGACQPGGGAWLVPVSPVSGSGGRSDSLFLEDKDDFTGTGKNPRRKRATPRTSSIKIKEAKTDERTFIALVGRRALFEWETYARNVTNDMSPSSYSLRRLNTKAHDTVYLFSPNMH